MSVIWTQLRLGWTFENLQSRNELQLVQERTISQLKYSAYFYCYSNSQKIFAVGIFFVEYWDQDDGIPTSGLTVGQTRFTQSDPSDCYNKVQLKNSVQEPKYSLIVSCWPCERNRIAHTRWVALIPKYVNFPAWHLNLIRLKRSVFNVR